MAIKKGINKVTRESPRPKKLKNIRSNFVGAAELTAGDTETIQFNAIV